MRGQGAQRSMTVVRSFGWTIAAVLLMVSWGGGPAVAQKVDRDKASKRLKADKAKLDKIKKEARKLKTDVAAARLQRRKLNERLIEMGQTIHGVEARLNLIEARLRRLNGRRQAAQSRLFANYASISKLLAAMQRMGRNPPPVIVTPRKDALQMVRSAMLMARAFPHLQDKARTLGKQLDEIQSLIGNIRTKRAELAAATKNLAAAQTELQALIDEKQKSVTEGQRRLKVINQTASKVVANVKSLSELIAKFDKAVAKRTKLGEYQQRDRKKDQQVALIPSPSTGGSIITHSPANSVFRTNPARLTPAIPFHKAKAKLPWPVVGRVRVAFGKRDALGEKSKGLYVDTRHGAQIVSPCDGWVVFAAPFRSYRQTLIINAGDGYHVLLAGMSTIDVQVGQFVVASEPVGTMDVKRKGKSKDRPPVLYIEFRKSGRPINPEPWWFKGSRKAEG